MTNYTLDYRSALLSPNNRPKTFRPLGHYSEMIECQAVQVKDAAQKHTPVDKKTTIKRKHLSPSSWYVLSCVIVRSLPQPGR